MLEDNDVQGLFAGILADVYGPASLTVWSTGTTRDPATGVFQKTSTSHSVRVQRDSCTQRQMAQKGYVDKDVRFLVLQSGVSAVPNTDCTISHRGENFDVMDIDEDPFRVYWDVRARKKK